MALTKTSTYGANTTTSTATVATTVTLNPSSLIVVEWICEQGGSGNLDAATAITTSGAAITFTKVADTHTVADINRCRVAIYAGYSDTAGSRTITHNRVGVSTNNQRIIVHVIEGAATTLAGAIPAGNRKTQLTNVTNLAIAYTPTVVGSMFVGSIGDWNAVNSSSWTAESGCTLSNGVGAAGASYWTAACEPTTNPQTSGAGFNWGATSASSALGGAVVEIVPIALPTVISGISTAVAPVGPFKSSGGNFYFFGRDGTTATTLQAYKSIAPFSYTIATNIVSANLFGSSVTNTGKYQTFTSGAGATLVNSVSFALRKGSGSPTDNLTVQIFAFDTGTSLPTGAALGTSTVIAGSTLTTTAARYAFTFPTPVSLAANTRYAALITRPAVDAANYYQIYGDTVANVNAGQGGGSYNVSTATFGTYGTTDLDLIVSGTSISSPDTSWSSIATKTGFATGIQYISAYQVADVIHMCITDGATTSINHKYQTFNCATDTFVTAETINSALNTTTSASANAYGTAIAVRSTAEVVVHYQAARISTFAQTAYRRRTGVATWAAGVAVSTTGVNSINPFVVLGASDRLHFLWFNSTNTIQRHLTSGNVLGTAASTGATATVQDVITIASGTPNFIGLTATSAFRWASADNPTVTNAAVTLGTPVRGADASSVSYALYQSSTDSDLYIKTSSDSGATWGTAISEFVGTVASADANLSKNQAIYTRDSATVFPYIVNDNGTLKYDEYPLSAGVTHYTMPVTVGTLTAAGQTVVPRVTMPIPLDADLTLSGQDVALQVARKTAAGLGTLTLAGQDVTLTKTTAAIHRTMPADTGTLALSGQTVVPRVTMPVTAGTLALGGQTVALRAIRKLAAGQGTLTLAGQNAVLTEKNTYGLIAGLGTLTLAGQPATLKRNYVMPAGYGALMLAGQPVALRNTRIPLLAGLGTLTLSGRAAALGYGRKPPAGLGTITLAGQTATLKRNYVMPAGLGTITLAGVAPNLIYSGAGSKLMPAGLGVVTLAGQTVTLRYAHKLIAGTGTIALAGQTVGLRASHLPLAAGLGTLTLSGQVVTTRFAHRTVAGLGTLTLAGQTAIVRYARKMPAGQGALTISGQNVTLRYSRKMPAGLGTITVLEPVVNLIYSGAGNKLLPAGIGFPRIDGQPVTLRYSRKMPAALGTITLAGQTVALQRARKITAGTGAIVLEGKAVGLNYHAQARLFAEAGVLSLTGCDVTLPITRRPPVIVQENLKFGRSVYVSRW